MCMTHILVGEVYLFNCFFFPSALIFLEVGPCAGSAMVSYSCLTWTYRLRKDRFDIQS